MEADEVFDIIQIRSFGAAAHVFEAYGRADLVEKGGGLGEWVYH